MNKEDLDLILDKHQDWLNDEPEGEKADLRGADLRWADLHGADLRGANLRGANLRWANLREANLREANFHGDDLRGANLREANLYGANLHGANLYGANLRGANLRGANLYGVSGNRNQIKSLFASEVYPITYTSEHLQIGCERHLITDWWGFDSAAIERMDGKSALGLWAEWKGTIKTIIEKSPAKQTGHEGETK